MSGLPVSTPPAQGPLPPAPVVPRPPRPPHHPLTVLAILGAMVVVLLAAANLLAWVAREAGSEQRAFDGPIRRVVVETSGDVTVVADDPGRTTVDVDAEQSWTFWRPDTTARVDGETLTVEARCRWPFGPGCRADYRLRVPPATELRVRTWAGDTEVRGVAGAIDVSSSAGDVTVADLTGEAVLRSGAGAVAGTRLRGPSVTAESGAGDVDLTFDAPPGRVDVASGAGDATVRVPPGSGPYRLDLPDGAGDALVRVETDSSADRSIAVRSGAGDVVVSYR